MSKNNKALRGLGEGLAQVGQTLLKDALETRRENAMREMQKEFQDKQLAMEQQRVDIARTGQTSEADYRGKALTEETRYHKDMTAAEREKIAAAEKAGKKQVVFQDEVIMDGKGNPVTRMDAQGNTVPVTTKIPYEVYEESGKTKIRKLSVEEAKTLAPPVPPAPGAAPVVAPAAPQAAAVQPGLLQQSPSFGTPAFGAGQAVRKGVSAGARVFTTLPRAVGTAAGAARMGLENYGAPFVQGLLYNDQPQ